VYAVIRVGGKQERVKAGDVIEVEFMHVDPGSQVEFQPILVVDDAGKPHHGKGLSEAKVVATLLGDRKGEKVKVFKYRQKTGYRKNQGHRQLMTLLEVQEVALVPGQTATKPEVEAAPETEKKAAPAKKATAKKPTAKKTPAKKPTAKKTPAKKPTAKKTTGRKPPTG
jgi:large subunit ribosomal protein L21